MNKIHLFFIILISLILLIQCETNDKNILEDDFDIEHLQEESFNKFKKTYLTERNLIGSDVLIKREEMKKIFIDIMNQGVAPEETDDYTKDLNEELAKIFINKYYKKRKEIRGKDIYDLIDYYSINQKYYQLIGEIPFYDEEDENFGSDL